MSKHSQGQLEVEYVKGEPCGFHELVAPTPEGLSAGSYTIADTLNRHHCISPEEDEANAARLALAWNCHNELVEACAAALLALRHALNQGFECGREILEIEAALAKAGVK